MDGTTTLWLSFLAGIYAPLGSPCVIVLYPAYLAFLAGDDGERKPGISPFSLGFAVALGVLLSLIVGGILFALALQVLGSAVRALVTPAAFLILLVFALLLLLDIDPFCYSGRIPLPRTGLPSPHGAALLLGLLFGIIILPCNAAIILVLIALATTATGAIESVGIFLAFGVGMILPLLLIAGISRFRSRQVMAFLTGHRLFVQRLAGLVMLLIAVWYLALYSFPALFR
jgi:cytochrome c biogenesis protein CcdA